MYVCVCRRVSDRHIAEMADESRPMTLQELVRSTGAGTCCGKCVPELRALVPTRADRSARSPAQTAFHERQSSDAGAAARTALAA